MPKTLTRKIDGCEVTLEELPYSRAVALGHRMVTEFGPALAELVLSFEQLEKLPGALQSFFVRLPHEELMRIAGEVLYNCVVRGPQKDSKPLPFIPPLTQYSQEERDAALDAAMEGKPKDVFFKSIAFGLKVNFEDFFKGGALEAAFGMLLAKTRQELTQRVSASATPSATASSSDSTPSSSSMPAGEG